MSVYEDLGATPAVNASGFATRLGGALIRKEVLAAMQSAAQSSVDMTTLQAAASRRIASITGSEAGLVTSGATAALQLAAAACLARLEVDVMDRLPDTSGIANEIIMLRTHRTGYDHGLRAAGASIRDVGYNTKGMGAGGRNVESWEIERVISDNTVAIAATATPTNHEEIAALARVANEADIPLIVDAAAQLPPRENLRGFINMGASLVAFSGGKALRGPQETGLLSGRQELIMSAALQMLDMDEAFETWLPPTDFIDTQLLAGLPQHGIGRGLKVSKEGVVGLVTALESYANEGLEGFANQATSVLDRIEEPLRGISSLHVERIDESRWGWPRFLIRVLEDAGVESVQQLSERLKRRSPAIYLNEQQLSEGALVIDPANLNEGDAQDLVSAIKEICDGETS